MLEPVHYDIGRMCKESYRKEGSYTPKIIDRDIVKGIKPPLLKIPFDSPREVAEHLLSINRDKLQGTVELEDCTIRYLLVNVGKHLDILDSILKDNLDLVIVGDARRLIKRKELVQLIQGIRASISPNTAIYFPTALPWEIPLLIYLGVDYFDYSSAYYYGSLGYYFTKNRMIPTGGDREEIVKHNIEVISQVLMEARYCIREGMLRNLVEETSVSDPYLRANYRRYEPDLRNIPLSKGKRIIVTIDETEVPEVKKYIERARNYELFTDTVVLLPCSSRKPYSQSKSHSYFIKAITSAGLPVEEVIITSPYGVVPRALEGVVNYDIPVTGRWSLEEIEFINRELDNLLRRGREKFQHLKIVAHLPDHYLEILRDTCERYGDLIVTSKGDPTSPESLKTLKNTLLALKEKYNIREREVRNLRRMEELHHYRELSKFQFRKNFIPDDVIVKGDVKKFFIKRDNRLIQICSINPETGLYILTYEGGKLLGKVNWIEVNFEVKKGSLFPPGFVDCDESISVRDEVVVIYENEVVGVGRAILSGSEMKRAEKGKLVNIRHIKK
ncbi:MAG TPA: Archaeosine synthase [Methanothermococcus okinawensis]|uniref:Archaeosine synthase n=1 Tax=Methanothermococcus okinawensis TaxID=155863 RepID=A0A832Z7Z4_9EURY|nr:Archaeosine synthase [Methanothermococcus okinawensis]